MKYNTTRLANGLRVIHLPSTSPVVYCGDEINAGTASETATEEGIAHFCEHATFKGTACRDSLDIIRCLENVGGDLNAYTTKTSTVYHSAILREHFPLAVDLLSDIVFRSVYPQKEIEKEVEVICDEIESYNDSPAELIYDEFENLLFKNLPLGHSILGTAKTVRQFTSEDAKRFTSRYYRPDNSVFFVYGDVDFNQVVALLQQHTGDIVPTEPLQLDYTEDATATIVKGAKNMDNAKLFIDFIISEEVQNIWGTTLTNRPVLKDAKTSDFMTPMSDIYVIEEDIPYVSAHKKELVNKYTDIFTSIESSK